MKLFTLVRTELGRITATRMGLVALVALMTVPVVYGGLYLWGNQDPYGKLDRVPAAIVVADTGAVVDGKAVSYGQDAADHVVDDATFDWTVVSSSAAARGVDDGDYDFVLTFPASFSRDLASASGDDPVQATLQLTTNDTNGYLSSTIAKQAAATIKASLVSALGETASRALLDGIADLRAGLVDASDGATQVASGAASASSGAASLASGTADLAAGSSALSTGLAHLDSSASSLPTGVAALASGASSVASGLGAASGAGSSLASLTSQAASLTPAVAAEVQAELTNAGVPAADQATILGQLDTLGTLTGQAKAVSAGLSPSLAQLSAGASQVSAGASALNAQAPALVSGIHTAAGGAASVSSGAAAAASGASTLSSGLTDLSSGAGELSSSLAAGVAKVPATTSAGRAATAAAIAHPVAVKQAALSAAQNYGAGLAPLFLSLAAWIGIYALFLMVRPLSRRALTAVRQPIRTTLAGWATPALLGAVQMAALFLIATLALHLQPANAVGLLGFMMLVSVTFAAIVLALNVWLGSVGQFLGLLLMILQLVTAGGTFPWQTLPAPLAALHQVLPMSHAVDGMRQLIYGGSAGAVGPALVLVAWLVASLAVSALGARQQSGVRTLRQLRPSPIGG